MYMNRVIVTNQAELEAAIKNKDVAVCSSGSFNIDTYENPTIEVCAGVQFSLTARSSSQPHVTARDFSQPHVTARDFSQPHVRARDSSQPHVTARDFSQPHVTARDFSQPHVMARYFSKPHVMAMDFSQPHVTACDSSQPHVMADDSSQPRVRACDSSQPHVRACGSSKPYVTACGYAQLSLFGNVIAKAAAKVSVLLNRGAKCDGGQQTVIDISTPQNWCDYYGVEVVDGVATLYKSVDDNFFSKWGINYSPGTIPVAPDWDGGKKECGGGLHFSPRPEMALEFNSGRLFVACPVKLSDMVVHPNGSYPEKVKAKGCCAPVWECDGNGKRI